MRLIRQWPWHQTRCLSLVSARKFCDGGCIETDLPGTKYAQRNFARQQFLIWFITIIGQKRDKLGDKYVYQHMLDYLDPTVGFEFDVYWAQTAGVDPAAAAANLRGARPLLHIKDGPATMDGDMTAVGEGVMDIQGNLRSEQGHGRLVGGGTGPLRDRYDAGRG